MYEVPQWELSSASIIVRSQPSPTLFIRLTINQPYLNCIALLNIAIFSITLNWTSASSVWTLILRIFGFLYSHIYFNFILLSFFSNFSLTFFRIVVQRNYKESDKKIIYIRTYSMSRILTKQIVSICNIVSRRYQFIIVARMK